jgi:hypothetical protein
MYPNLKEIEDILFSLSIKTIQLFAQTHKEEKFYGFGFDVNVDYGEVLLCFNTEEDFQKIAKDYIEKWNYSEEDIEQLRMNFGDWKYQGVNLDLDYIKDWSLWSNYKKDIQSYFSSLFDMYESNKAIEESQKFSELFLECIIHVLIRLENNGVFNLINRENNFITLVINHDEDEDEFMERMKSVRERY